MLFNKIAYEKLRSKFQIYVALIYFALSELKSIKRLNNKKAVLLFAVYFSSFRKALALGHKNINSIVPKKDYMYNSSY